ncbi:MAG: 50S ribosomal protein L9 [SAR116 cluster bacterium]|nr:50S ribosomal protein L9 [SAR116 cluster bacterium]
MNIILTEKINNLGKLGDIVKVKGGYARNFLLPQGKAIRATKDNIESFNQEKSKIEAENESNKKDAQKLSESIEGLSIVLIRPASETGQLYGSVSTRDISNSINESNFSITHKQVILDKPIKELGIQRINISLHPEVIVPITLNTARTIEEAKTQEKTGSAVVQTKEENTNDLLLEPSLDVNENESKKMLADDSSSEINKT